MVRVLLIGMMTVEIPLKSLTRLKIRSTTIEKLTVKTLMFDKIRQLFGYL